MIEHVLRHEEEILLRGIIEGKINGKRDRGRPKTSKSRFPGLTNHKELKRLAW